MAEHSDIYLLLYRQSGSYSEIQANKITAPIVLAKLIKGMIIGDSLDAPFVGFIKVEGIDHSIGLQKSQAELEYDDSQQFKVGDDMIRRRRSLLNRASDIYENARLGPLAAGEQERARGLYRARRERIEGAYDRAVREQRNAFISAHLPKHEELTFTKMIDRATPQLAFGCSAQERFPCALFFYRRKIGFGVGGIRIPHLVVGLRKVRITSWQMKENETETISLRYADIAWAALGQIADSSMPMPVPTARMFSVEDGAGGETYDSSWAYGVQAIAAGMSLLAGAVVKGLSTASHNGSYQS